MTSERRRVEELEAELAALHRERDGLGQALRLAEEALGRCERLLVEAVPCEEAFNPFAYGLPEDEAAEVTKAVTVAGDEARRALALLDAGVAGWPPAALPVEGRVREVWPLAVAWRRGRAEYGLLCEHHPDEGWALDVRDAGGNTYEVPLASLCPAPTPAEGRG